LAKNLKLNIKNAQIAQAIDLGGLKTKLAKKKAEPAEIPPPVEEVSTPLPTVSKESGADLPKEEAPRVRARSKSAFSEPAAAAETKVKEPSIAESARSMASSTSREESADFLGEEPMPKRKSGEELRKEIFGEDVEIPETKPQPFLKEVEQKSRDEIFVHEIEPEAIVEPRPSTPVEAKKESPPMAPPRFVPREQHRPHPRPPMAPRDANARSTAAAEAISRLPSREKLGPTGKHIKDFLTPPPKPVPKPVEGAAKGAPTRNPDERKPPHDARGETKKPANAPPKTLDDLAKEKESGDSKKGPKSAKAKEFRDVKPVRKGGEPQKTFDARDRQGLRSTDETNTWRKRRQKQAQRPQEDLTIRPSAIKVIIPISIKDLAVEMKLKASQLISKLFMQGLILTINDYLDDETTIQLLGQEFGCEIAIDTAEKERLQVTDKTIRQEISETNQDLLTIRPPIVAFMGHVDHGKTSLIDAIRKSNVAAGEAGAITQHIGAFKCHTAIGDIAILDTPGHEAFSAMRARGADVTDIVVLVVAGDEGIRQQTIEAIQHAKAAHVSIVVALNKCDKPNFNAEMVYRQLAEHELVPEGWGGQTITVNCSATTGEGLQQLLEMLALQAEVMELKASLTSRARGTVLESEMHKGMGSVATVLVQNGTLRLGDALVFGQTWGRVKTMRDEFRKDLSEAGPSTPIEITGLSGLPEAGEEFIVVKNEREAREIAAGRMQDIRQTHFQKKKMSMENLFQQAADGTSKKILNIVLKADVQGSLEALKTALMKIESKKAEINIISTGVGEVLESDVQLAAASKAVILGFHTQVESHADELIKQLSVQVRLHNIIYHAIDDIKVVLADLLDKVAIETEKGKTEVKATFKSSHHGVIAGCMVIEGSIHRSHQTRVKRDGEVIWKGTISSLKRVKEDVREVTKGIECGVLLNGFNDFKEGDIIESYEITYIVQEL
jgi:translation initiation factor IF-2